MCARCRHRTTKTLCKHNSRPRLPSAFTTCLQRTPEAEPTPSALSMSGPDAAEAATASGEYDLTGQVRARRLS